MTREDHLEFCSICTKRKMNLKVGLVCSYTDKIADFDTTCSTFELDKMQQEQMLLKKLAATGDGEGGDDINFKKNIQYGPVIALLGVLIMLVSFAIDTSGYTIIPTGLIASGIFMTARGYEQKKIYKSHFKSNERVQKTLIENSEKNRNDS